MKRRANATLIGVFAVAGIALLLAVVIAAGGGKLFVRKERVVMHFSGSIYGLQLGAPVVFRGVRLGTVSSISVVYDKSTDDFIIPVTADLDPAAIRGLASNSDAGKRTVLPDMVARGLKAQLSMQSLLTGQLYVDLDLRPQKPSVLRGSGADLGGALEIPTTATAIQQLKNQLDGLDFRRLLDDVSAIAASARSVVAGPQLKKAMDDLAAITGHVRRVSESLDAKFDPLVKDASSAAKRVGTAADGVSDTAKRLGSAADRYKELVAPNSPLVKSLQKTIDELAVTAGALREDLGPDSALLQNADKALQDMARAARSVRELSDQLDRHPDALIRGRRSDDPIKPEPPK